MNTRIAQQRLENQRLTRPRPRDPGDMVAWFGAVQAQDYPAAKWALALRMPDGTTDARIERAFNDGRILRTHVMRPTWHFVAAPDLPWMLERNHPGLRLVVRAHGRRRKARSRFCNSRSSLEVSSPARGRPSSRTVNG